MILAQLDTILASFAQNVQSENFACTKELTFRRSAVYISSLPQFTTAEAGGACRGLDYLIKTKKD